MKKLSLKYLFERIQKIENEYQKKPKTYIVILNKISEKKAIEDLKKLGWKEINDFFNFSLKDTHIRLEKKEYENE